MARSPQASARRKEAADIASRGFSRDWIKRYLGGAERRRVTMVVCGVDRASRLAETQDPEELAAAIALLRKHVCGTVEEMGGHVGGGAGLVVSAFWGYPQTAEDHTRLAVLAALKLASSHIGGDEVSCAIDCGLVVAGVIGEAGGSADLVGPALHRAEQLQRLAPPGCVVVTDIVKELIEEAFLVAPCTDADGCWRVISARSPHSNPAPSRQQTIGQAPQRKQLDEVWRRVLSGQPECVSVCGEAGIGKTRLIRSLEGKVAAAEGLWVEVDCRPETRRAALHPVRECLRSLIAKHGPGLTGFVSRLPDDDRDLVGRFLGLAGASADTPPKAATLREHRLLRVLLDWLADLSAAFPLAIVLEDLHCADPATLQFMQQAGERLAELRCTLLVFSSRDREPAGLRTAARRTRLCLERLGPSEIAELLRTHPAGAALPPAVREQIAVRSEGVPLFAEELARLFSTEGRSNQDDLDLLLEPGPLNMVLSARLDALGELKPLAQAASVIGRECEAAVLAKVLDMDASQLGTCLAGLVNAGLLEPLTHRGRTGAYRFTHALLRDAAYASVLKSRRRDLHRRVAEVMVQDPREAASCPEVVAGHFSAAGDRKGAFSWWFAAGRRATEISATRASVEHFRRALSAREQDPEAGTLKEEIELLRALGLQLAALKGNAAPEVIATLQRCLDLSKGLAGSTPDFDASWMLHSCHLVRGDVDRALKIGERLLATVGEGASDERRLKTHRMQGLAKLLAGRLEEAFEHYEVVLETYNEAQHAELRFQHASDQGALAHAHLAWGQAIAERLDSSALHAEAGLALASRLQHPHSSAHVVCVLAARAQTLGDRQQASALAFTGKALAERHEFPYWSAWADFILGWAETDNASDSVIETAISAYRRTGALQALPYALLLRADARLAHGRPADAACVLEEAWRIAGAGGVMLYGPEILRQQAVAHARLGSGPAKARLLARQAAELAQAQGAHLFRRRAEQLLTTFEAQNAAPGPHGSTR